MKAYCKNCEALKVSSMRPGQDASTGETFFDLCCDDCHYVIATMDQEPSMTDYPARIRQLLEALERTNDMSWDAELARLDKGEKK